MIPKDNFSRQTESGPNRTPMECGHARGGRNLVVCIDGTSNQFGDMNTNVIELYNLLLKEEEHNQLTWYNSGIGTYAPPSWKSLDHYKQVIYHKIDLAIAWSFEKTVLGAYRWLSDNHKKGDSIFLFGFSRGAFQVRALSAMIYKIGLIHKGNEMQIPFAYELYADPKSSDKKKVGNEEISPAEHFKRTFSRKDVKVHFVGAWDTVSSIGIASGHTSLPHTVDGMKHVCYFRHALALDERRVKFLPEYAYGGAAEASPTKKTLDHETSGEDSSSAKKAASSSQENKGWLQQVKEVWFAGTHTDIGGGINFENKTKTMEKSRPPLRWMVFEAAYVGLRTAEFQRELSSTESIGTPEESLTWHWWPLEILPFMRQTFTREEAGAKNTHKPHLGRSRKIHHGQKIHASFILAGHGEKEYTPKARPPKDAKDFWKKLDTEFREWRELDVYDSIDSTVDDFIVKADDTTLRSLTKVVWSGTGRHALYEKLIATLREDGIGAEIRYRLLRSSIDILRKDSSGGLPFKLVKSVEFRGLFRGLKVNELDSNRVLKDFIEEFTDRAVYVLQGHVGGINSVAFSPDCKRIASGSYDHTVRLWNAENGETDGPPLRGHEELVRSVAFSPDGKWVVSGSTDKEIRLWDVDSRESVGKPFKDHPHPVRSVAFSPDSMHVFSSSLNGTIRMWNVQTRESEKPPFKGHIKTSLYVAFSSDGKQVVSGSKDGTILLWNAETREPHGNPFRGHKDPIFCIAFSPDGRHVVSGSEEGIVRLWNVVTGEADGEPFGGHSASVFSVAFSPDGKRLASGSRDGTVQLWSVETRKADGPPLKGHTGNVLSVAFSPDGKRVASGSLDQILRVWDVEE